MEIKPKNFTLILLCTATAHFLTSCDGGSSPEDEIAEKFPDVIQRGFNLSEIESNPTATPGFPTVLELNETITFIPEGDFDYQFLDEVPLGTYTTNSSGLLRAGDSSSSSLYFPVNENSFTYQYLTAGSSNSNGSSTDTAASIQYSDGFSFTDLEFDQRMANIQASSQSPGSLGFAIATADEDDYLGFDFLLFGESAEDARTRIYVDSAASVGMAAAGQSAFSVSTSGEGIFGRKSRTITLSDISSTNAQLLGETPIITGRYSITDRWDEAEVHDNRLTMIFNLSWSLSSTQEGSFIIRLNELDINR